MTERKYGFLTLKEALSEVIDELCGLTGCQSVGIRLENGGDYPYYVYRGFPVFFIQRENSLLARDEEGNVLLDDEGKPFLECMCGLVIKGLVDFSLPYFTEHGSFWTNCTTNLLAEIPEGLMPRNSRKMCHYSGYESAALIPVRAEKRTVGLIQLNDPRENMFSPDMIRAVEAIADLLGWAVAGAMDVEKKLNGIFELIDHLKHK